MIATAVLLLLERQTVTYDFETIMDRRGKDALAVDAIGAGVEWAIVPTKPKNGFSVIPMWVADMNFATVPTILQAPIFLSGFCIGCLNRVQRKTRTRSHWSPKTKR